MESVIEVKKKLCKAGRTAVDELIKIAEEPIINRLSEIDNDSATDDLTADKLTSAAKAKKICIMDAFEILAKVEAEEALIESINSPGTQKIPSSFAERRAKPAK
jgi:hypothetical protein